MGEDMAFEGNGKNAKGLDGMKDPVVVIVGLSVRIFLSSPSSVLLPSPHLLDELFSSSILRRPVAHHYHPLDHLHSHLSRPLQRGTHDGPATYVSRQCASAGEGG